MKLDFTLKTYKTILEKFSGKGYTFQTLQEFSLKPASPRAVIVRHDVDRTPNNGIKMALIENSLGIKASYYFRIVNESYDENAIKKIIDLGHELGYHYEDLSLCNGNKEMAYNEFLKNLENFRKFYPVKTICMHGSPMSEFDNRLLWKTYDYKTSGIISEPYFDLDFDKVFYITDASRSWNNEAITIRDKVKTGFKIQIESGFDILNKIENELLPDYVMLSTHPHNWAEKFPEWLKIKAWQGAKNIIKRLIVLKG